MLLEKTERKFKLKLVTFSTAMFVNDGLVHLIFNFMGRRMYNTNIRKDLANLIKWLSR